MKPVSKEVGFCGRLFVKWGDVWMGASCFCCCL